jgi:hypothetical protein
MAVAVRGGYQDDMTASVSFGLRSPRSHALRLRRTTDASGPARLQHQNPGGYGAGSSTGKLQ